MVVNYPPVRGDQQRYSGAGVLRAANRGYQRRLRESQETRRAGGCKLLLLSNIGVTQFDCAFVPALLTLRPSNLAVL